MKAWPLLATAGFAAWLGGCNSSPGPQSATASAAPSAPAMARQPGVLPSNCEVAGQVDLNALPPTARAPFSTDNRYGTVSRVWFCQRRDSGSVFSLEGDFQAWSPKNALQVVQVKPGLTAALQGKLWVTQPTRREMLVATSRPDLEQSLSSVGRSPSLDVSLPLSIHVAGKTAPIWARNVLGEGAPTVSAVTASADKAFGELRFRFQAETDAAAKALFDAHQKDGKHRMALDGRHVTVTTPMNQRFLNELLSGLTRLSVRSG